MACVVGSIVVETIEVAVSADNPPPVQVSPTTTTIEVAGLSGIRGPRGEAGESGLNADTTTDFELIYRLST